MTSKYFIDLFNYDSTMNRKVLDLLRRVPSADEKSKNIFFHILAAKKIWIQRLCGDNSSNIAIWPTLSFDECETLIEENREAYRSYLSGKSETHLEADITSRQSKGTGFQIPAQDILMHVLIHSGYHRGQIARAVREAGEEPINTDYFKYLREQASSE